MLTSSSASNNLARSTSRTCSASNSNSRITWRILRTSSEACWAIRGTLAYSSRSDSGSALSSKTVKRRKASIWRINQVIQILSLAKVPFYATGSKKVQVTRVTTYPSFKWSRTESSPGTTSPSASLHQAKTICPIRGTIGRTITFILDSFKPWNSTRERTIACRSRPKRIQ